MPPSVASGSVVNVYLVAKPAAAGAGAGGGPRAGEPVLAAATVVDAPALAESFGTTGKRQLVLVVTEADAGSYLAALAALDNPVVTVAQAS